MTTYTESEQRALDEESGAEMDRQARAARLAEYGRRQKEIADLTEASTRANGHCDYMWWLYCNAMRSGFDLTKRREHFRRAYSDKVYAFNELRKARQTLEAMAS